MRRHHHESLVARLRQSLAPVAVATLAVLIAASCLAAVPTEPLSLSGPEFHVACSSGPARGTGSAASPWTSLQRVAQHGAFAPGDRILLRRGTTCVGTLDLRGSGTPDSPIVLGAEGGGSRPTIAGGGSKSGTAAIQLANVSWWTVQDLRITNTTGTWNPSAYRAGVLFRSTNSTRQMGLVARRLLVEHVDSNPGGTGDTRAWGGIVAQTTRMGMGFGGMLIRDNRVSDVGRSGIAVFDRAYPRSSDRDLHIAGNRVDHARGDSVVVSGVDGARIDHNVSAYGSNISECSVKQCGRMGGPTTANAAIWPTMSSGIRIDHNEVYGEHAEAGDGSGIDIDLGAHDVVVEQNYLHDNGRGGVMFCGARDTVVRFNVLENNKQSAFWFTCGWAKDQRPKNITIANNDVIVDRSATWVVRNVHPFAGKNIAFVNNLVFCSGSCAYTWPNKPVAKSNTYIGKRSNSEPVGTGTRHTSPGLRAPGTGRIGFQSLTGYRLRRGTKFIRGVALSTAATDIFGHEVDTSHPIRGASSS